MDTQPDPQQHVNGPRHAFNGLIFALIVFAVLLGGSAGWMRYSSKRACGVQDAAEQAMGALLPQFSLAGGLAPVGVTPRFICPQCSSYCWTQSRTGSPLCPFCKQAMVQESPGILPVAGFAVDTTSPISIQAGVKATHNSRGVCSNCHTVVKTVNSGLTPAMTPAAAVAPPIAPDAVKPLLIKPFGVEVCPAPGDGAMVTGVMGNSNASRAGLVRGDIIVECNGKKVADAEGFMKLVTAAPPEANAQLKVVRNGRLQKVAIMVGEGEMEGFTPIPAKK